MDRGEKKEKMNNDVFHLPLNGQDRPEVTSGEYAAAIIAQRGTADRTEGNHDNMSERTATSSK